MRLNAFAGIATLLSFALLTGAVGCCSGEFRSFDTITVSLDDTLRDARNTLPRVEVNILAVNSQDLPVWKNMLVPHYYDTRREADGTFVMSLDEGQKYQSFSVNDADPKRRDEAKRIWKVWESIKATNLVVIANYPPPASTISAEQDARKAILPLTCEAWPRSQREIVLKVTPLGLSVLTPPIPPGK